jgi:hypothetical protein
MHFIIIYSDSQIFSASSHVWLFEGAEGGKWLQALARDEREGPKNPGGRETKKVKIAQ